MAAQADPLPPQPSGSRSLMAAQGLAVGSDDPYGLSGKSDLFTGAFTQSVPISVPAGRGGAGPNLELVYRSGGANGFLGVGWDLALPAIERSTRHGLSYSGDDYVVRLAGAGDLVSVGGGEYRAKIEKEFMRVRKVTAGDGRAFWEVTSRLGVRYQFGVTAASRQDNPADPSQIFSWCLERVEDPNGNYFTIAYFKDAGAIYPDTVSYTGNGSEAPPQSVTLRRDAGLRADRDPSYRTGFSVVTRYRLQSIEVRAAGQVDRAYALEYATSGSSARSLLARVRRIGADAVFDASGVATGSALPDHAFTYSAGAVPSGGSFAGPTVSAGLSASGVVNFDLARVRYGDFNGDGRTDVAYVDGLSSLTPMRIFLSSGTGFGPALPGPSRSVGATASAAMNDIARVKIGDFNGDGRSDLLIIESGVSALPVAVYLANPDGTFPSQPSFRGPTVQMLAVDVDVSRLMLGDFNGDGQSDILYFPPSTTAASLAVYLSNGSGFSAPIFGPLFGTTEGVAALARVKLGDYNGDGATEIGLLSPGAGLAMSIYALNAARTGFVYLMAGPIRTVRTDPKGQRIDASRLSAVDVNGDGLTDFVALEGNGTVAPMSIYLATGNGFAARADGPSRYFDSASPDASLARLRFGDFNGDGRTDIAFIEGTLGSAAASIHLSEGDHYAAAQLGPMISVSGGTTLSYELGRVGVGDFDGDGRADFIVNNASGGSAPMSVFPAQGQVPDLLATRSNGIGGTLEVVYLPSSRYQNSQLPSPVQTVSAVTVRDGNGVVAVTTYAFGGGYYHFGDREFRGFNRAEVTGPAGPDGEQALSSYWFHQGNDVAVDQNDPSAPVGYSKGKAYRVQEWDLGRRSYVEKLTSYWPAPAPPHFAPPREQRTLWCEQPSGASATCGRSARTTFAVFDASGAEVTGYDPYGNVLRENQYGDEADATDDRTVIRTFQPSAASGIVGLAESESIYPGAGSGVVITPGPPDTEPTPDNRLAATWNFYDGTLSMAAPTPCKSTGSSGTPSRGNLTRVVRLRKNDTDPEEWAGFDGYGNVTCRSDADRRVTLYTYDGSSHTFQTSVTNAKNHTTSTQYYGVEGVAADKGRYGQPKKVTDPNLSVTDYEYDTFGRKTKEAKPPVPSPLSGDPYPGFSVTTSYFLGSVGVNRTESLTSAGEQTVEYLDGVGRVYLTRRKGSDLAGARVLATATTYNATGTKRRTSLPYQDTATPAVRYTTFAYDASGRVTAMTRPDGTTALSCYRDLDGASASVDASGHRKRQVTDVRGKLVRVQEYLGTFTSCTNDEGTPYATTTYQYDRLGRLTTITDAASNQSVTDYDSLGRRAFQSDPDLGTWTYGYYPSGDLAWQQDANGASSPTPYKVYFNYDELHRLILKDNPSGIDDVHVYDDPAVPYSKGKLTRTTDSSGSTTYGYDAVGRSASRVQTTDGVAYRIETGYDVAGRLAREVYPDAARTAATYEYDADGFLWKVYLAGVTQATLSLYNPLGQLGRIQLVNGVTTDYVYNDAGNNRLHSITTARGTTGLLSLTYGYDAVRNVTSITDDIVPANGQSFTYDALNRLASATSAGFAAVPYSDAAYGAAAAGPGVAYGYDPIKVHAVASTSDGRSYAYDANGNLRSDGTRVLQYDYANRPSAITLGGTQLGFTYDANGARVTKRVWSGATLLRSTVYVGRLYECSAGVCTRNLFAGDRRIASYSSDGTTRYYHADHLGSTRVVTDGAGAAQESTLYLPYGDAAAPAAGAKYRYTGQELDAESGLYCYGARYYNAVLGRFVSADPSGPDIGNPQALNRYSYVLNNPIFLVDPSGYEGEDPMGNQTGDPDYGASSDYQTMTAGELARGMEQRLDAATAGWQRDPDVGRSFLVVPAAIGNLLLKPLHTGESTATAVYADGLSVGKRALLIADDVGNVASIAGGLWGFAGRLGAASRTPAEILQSITTAQNAKLAANPALARTVLSPAEYAAGEKAASVARLQWGNAVERLAAREIADSPQWRAMFRHVGGPNRPDFVGVGRAAGMTFDITTPGQVASHLARPYGSGMRIATYQRPMSFTVFPE